MKSSTNYHISVSTREGYSHYSKNFEGSLEDAIKEWRSIASWQSGNITKLFDVETGNLIKEYGRNNKPGYTERLY